MFGLLRTPVGRALAWGLGGPALALIPALLFGIWLGGETPPAASAPSRPIIARSAAPPPPPPPAPAPEPQPQPQPQLTPAPAPAPEPDSAPSAGSGSDESGAAPRGRLTSLAAAAPALAEARPGSEARPAPRVRLQPEHAAPARERAAPAIEAPPIETSPTEARLTEHAPTETAPTESAPTESAPTESAPAESALAEIASDSAPEAGAPDPAARAADAVPRPLAKPEGWRLAPAAPRPDGRPGSASRPRPAPVAEVAAEAEAPPAPPPSPPAPPLDSAEGSGGAEGAGPAALDDRAAAAAIAELNVNFRQGRRYEMACGRAEPGAERVVWRVCGDDSNVVTLPLEDGGDKLVIRAGRPPEPGLWRGERREIIAATSAVICVGAEKARACMADESCWQNDDYRWLEPVCQVYNKQAGAPDYMAVPVASCRAVETGPCE